jgi:hypothetical protein
MKAATISATFVFEFIADFSVVSRVNNSLRGSQVPLLWTGMPGNAVP